MRRGESSIVEEYDAHSERNGRDNVDNGKEEEKNEEMDLELNGMASAQQLIKLFKGGKIYYAPNVGEVEDVIQ